MVEAKTRKNTFFATETVEILGWVAGRGRMIASQQLCSNYCAEANPAIALQALVDIGRGLIAWLALRRARGSGDMVAA